MLHSHKPDKVQQNEIGCTIPLQIHRVDVIFIRIFNIAIREADLILPAALGPGVYSASNRNEYQKHKNNVSGE
jgi:hypothetical protein